MAGLAEIIKSYGDENLGDPTMKSMLTAALGILNLTACEILEQDSENYREIKSCIDGGIKAIEAGKIDIDALVKLELEVTKFLASIQEPDLASPPSSRHQSVAPVSDPVAGPPIESSQLSPVDQVIGCPKDNFFPFHSKPGTELSRVTRELDDLLKQGLLNDPKESNVAFQLLRLAQAEENLDTKQKMEYENHLTVFLKSIKSRQSASDETNKGKLKTVIDAFCNVPGWGGKSDAKDFVAYRDELDILEFEIKKLEKLRAESRTEQQKIIDILANKKRVRDQIKKNLEIANKEAKSKTLGIFREKIEKHPEWEEPLKNFVEKYILWIGDENKSKSCMRPIILTGPPGTGKTSFASVIADIMGVSMNTMQMSHEPEAHEFIGRGREWQTPSASLLVEGQDKNNTKMGVQLIDEVDKGGKASKFLGDFLEESTLGADDKMLGGKVPKAHTFWVLTANDIGSVPDFILDRADKVKFNGYNFDDRVKILRKIWNEMLKTQSDLPNLNFNDDVLKTFINKYSFAPGIRQDKALLKQMLSKIAFDCINKSENTIDIDIDMVQKWLGAPSESVTTKKELYKEIYEKLEILEKLEKLLGLETQPPPLQLTEVIRVRRVLLIKINKLIERLKEDLASADTQSGMKDVFKDEIAVLEMQKYRSSLLTSDEIDHYLGNLENAKNYINEDTLINSLEQYKQKVNKLEDELSDLYSDSSYSKLSEKALQRKRDIEQDIKKNKEIITNLQRLKSKFEPSQTNRFGAVQEDYDQTSDQGGAGQDGASSLFNKQPNKEPPPLSVEGPKSDEFNWIKFKTNFMAAHKGKCKESGNDSFIYNGVKASLQADGKPCFKFIDQHTDQHIDRLSAMVELIKQISSESSQTDFTISSGGVETVMKAYSDLTRDKDSQGKPKLNIYLSDSLIRKFESQTTSNSKFKDFLDEYNREKGFPADHIARATPGPS